MSIPSGRKNPDRVCHPIRSRPGHLILNLYPRGRDAPEEGGPIPPSSPIRHYMGAVGLRSTKDHHRRSYFPNGTIIIHPLPNPPEEPKTDPKELRRGAKYLELLSDDFIRDHFKSIEDRKRGD